MTNQLVIAVPPRHADMARMYAAKWPVKGPVAFGHIEAYGWSFWMAESPSKSSTIKVKLDEFVAQGIPVIMVHVKETMKVVTDLIEIDKDPVQKIEYGQTTFFYRIRFTNDGLIWADDRAASSVDMQVHMTAEATKMQYRDYFLEIHVNRFEEPLAFAMAALQHTEDFVHQDEYAGIYNMQRLLAGD